VAAALQARHASIVARSGQHKNPSRDVTEAGDIGNLADRRVQHELDPRLDGIDLLALNKLPSLTAMT
jgi:hypothetical protein